MADSVMLFLLGFIVAVILVVIEALLWPKKVVKMLTKEDASDPWFTKDDGWKDPGVTLDTTEGATISATNREYTLVMDLSETLKESKTTLTAEDVTPTFDIALPATDSVTVSVAENKITFTIDRTTAAATEGRTYTSAFDVGDVQMSVIIDETASFIGSTTAPAAGDALFEVTYALTFGGQTWMTDPTEVKVPTAV